MKTLYEIRNNKLKNVLWNISEFPRNVDCNYTQGILNRTWYFTWHFLWIKLNMYSIWYFLEIRYQVKVSNESSQKFPLNVTYEKLALVKLLVKCKTVGYVWMRLLWYITVYCLKWIPRWATKGTAWRQILRLLLKLTWTCIHLLSFVTISWNTETCCICNFHSGWPITILSTAC